MANETLNVILKLITGDYKRQATEAASATARIGTAATGATGGLRGLQSGMNVLRGSIAVLGITALVGEFKDMALAAAEDAQAQELLANALRTNVGATDTMIASNERWISTMQIATSTADNDLRQAIQDLTVAGRTLEQSQGDVAIALDIAASKGIELSAVIKALVRAQASGSNAGLARLGIETKNAAGEMLAYDEVLKNAATTMGGTAARAAGTLAGALERGRIAMEEAREEAGANFTPVMVQLTDAWNEFMTAVLGGDSQLAGLQSIFNSLITDGIDPFKDAVDSAGFVLTEFARQFREDIDLQTFEALVAMLGLTNDQVLELRRNFIKNGEAVVENKDKLAAIVGVLDAYVGNVDPAVLATRRFLKAQEDAAHGTRDFTDALEEQRNLLREMTSPFFALLGANERLTEANRNLNEIMASGDTTSMEYQSAIEDLLRAQMEYNFAQAEAVATGESAINVFGGLAAQAGINTGVFLTWAEAVDTLAGSIARLPSRITTTGGSFNTVTSGSPFAEKGFAHGGVVPGQRGEPVLAVVHAGETILPTHKRGLPQFDNGGIVGGFGMMSPVSMPTWNGGSKSVIFNLPTAEGPIKPLDLQYLALLANHMTLLD